MCKSKNYLRLCLLFGLSLITSCSGSENEPQGATIQEPEPVSEYKADGDINGHPYVDLGLPSEMLWATCNVGATNPEDYGDYYAWGEKSSKSEYTASNSYTDGGGGVRDFSGNGKFDVARDKWGETWRIPTNTELMELRSKCTWTWTTLNGVNGYKVTGPNGNSLFLPAGGSIEDSSLESVGIDGNYWSSTPEIDNTHIANGIYFDMNNCERRFINRYVGINVRPISISYYEKNETSDTPTTGTIAGHEYVDLGLPSGLKWATCNVGATTPEDYGDYYAWGGISPLSENGDEPITTIEDISGHPDHDAARANWGGTWRMPRKLEMDELINNCTWTSTTLNGVYGYKVTGINGNHIFLPAAGYIVYSSLRGIGSSGRYWISTRNAFNSEYAYTFQFSSSSENYNSAYAYESTTGQSVRPVTE